MKNKFIIPNTKSIIVVWYRDGKKNEQLIPTPANINSLYDTMLKYRVGRSEIRAVKAVKADDLAQAIIGNRW